MTSQFCIAHNNTSILILGTGKSGTSAIYAAFSSHPLLTPMRDKGDYQEVLYESLPISSVAKLDTIYIKSTHQLVDFLDTHQHVKVIWVTRDVRDIVLSKITTPFYSKRPNHTPDDATKEGCLKTIQEAFDIYNECKNRFELLKFEDFLSNPEVCLREICNRIGFEYSSEMLNYQSLMNKHKIYTRYSNDKPKISKWKQYSKMKYAQWLDDKGFTKEVLDEMFDRALEFQIN